ncbi:MAG: amino acid decarboxylase [Bryobacterales bacterium]|nr:amino acid decarboxylase [Bryobacterales bacterium]
MSFDMPAEEFRKSAHEVVDWIADYLEGIRDYRVMPMMEPGSLVRSLPKSGPEQGEPAARILEDFRDLVIPAVNHWNHPRFFGYFSVSASHPGILGEMLMSALNVNGMLWKSCPAATELEQVTLGWLRQWLGLPEEFFGIIYDTASISTMHAIAAAREMADPEARQRGGAQNLVLYCSEQAHSSVEKGAITIGVGQRNVRKIAADDQFRLRTDLLKTAIEEDARAGKKPFCIVATVGTTSITSVDPVSEIVPLAEKHGMWLHIDGAYGGTAALVPEHRHILDGATRAHSLVINPHKWLFTPQDASVFYTRKPDILRRAFSLVAEYLRTAEDERVVNYMDYGVQLGRRFRSLKLWFVLRYFGREGIIKILRNHIAWAKELACVIDADSRFEVAAPARFSLVCFRFRGSDEQNRLLLDRINADGQAFLSHTVLNGRFVLRLAIGDIKTTREDVMETWKCISKLADTL